MKQKTHHSILSLLFVTIFALSSTVLAIDLRSECGVRSQEEIQGKARRYLDLFTNSKNFDRWIYWQAVALSKGKKFDRGSTEKRFSELESWLNSSWTETLKKQPELGIVETVLRGMQSHPAFHGKQMYIPSVFGEMIGGCEALCILSGEAFVLFVNPEFIKNLATNSKTKSITVDSSEYQTLRFILAHELSHAIHSYVYILKERNKNRWALPTELKGKGFAYHREHLIIDAIATLLADMNYIDVTGELDRTTSTLHQTFGKDFETDISFRSSCLKSLPVR